LVRKSITPGGGYQKYWSRTQGVWRTAREIRNYESGGEVKLSKQGGEFSGRAKGLRNRERGMSARFRQFLG